MSLNSQIADLILERGRAQAQGDMAWGGALSQIGQTVGRTVAAIPAIKAEAARVGDEQRARDARSALSKAMKDVPPIKQEGMSLYDVQGIGKAMADSGYGAEFGPAAGHLDAINQSTIGFQQGRLHLLKSGAEAIAAAGFDPVLADDFLEHQKGNQIYSDQTIQSWQDRIRGNPEATKAVISYLAGPQKMVERDPTKEQRDPITNELVTPATPELKFVNGQAVNPMNARPVGAPIPKQVTPLAPEEVALKKSQLAEIDAKLAGTLPISATDQARLKLDRDKLNAEIKHWQDTEEGAPILTPEAKRIAAQQWAMTGTMVAAGMGKAGTKMRADIMNEAGEVYKGLNLPAQMAAFKANEASLVRITGTLDNLTSFEKAANKNIDTFINLTKNLPDTGVPWANMPLRLLSDKMVGSEYLPAIQAARQIATREVARVVNDPGLKGELTDAARKGVDAMLSGDITIAQMKQVLPVFRSDMDNVRTSLSEQQKDIASRIASPPGTAPPAAKVPDAVLPGFTITRKPGG